MVLEDRGAAGAREVAAAAEGVAAVGWVGSPPGPESGRSVCEEKGGRENDMPKGN